jgi:hypothetical protein
VATSPSRGFCTTSTWNCRGRSITAAIDTSSIAVQRVHDADGGVPNVSRLDHSGWSTMREKMSANPSKSPQVTKPPTRRKATSLTMDSTATADMRPVCPRVKSRLRAPKRIPKRASMAATSKAGSKPERTECSPIIMAKDTETAFSCSAM